MAHCLPQILHAAATANRACLGEAELEEYDRMIGEALEITIVVSMLVLVIYPSTMMVMEALQERRRRRIRVVQDRRRRDQR